MIEALSKAVNVLTEEVQNIKTTSQSELDELFWSTQYNRRRISITLASEASYHHARNVLKDMNEEQYKSFHVGYYFLL